MIDLVRALPQGMFWYPVLFFLALALLRAVWSVRVGLARSPQPATGESDHIMALAHLVERAQTDGFGYQELERRCIGLLLETRGYAGYSVESCRAFAADEAGTPIAEVIGDHLLHSAAGGTGGAYAIDDPMDRVNRILKEVERTTEESGG